MERKAGGRRGKKWKNRKTSKLLYRNHSDTDAATLLAGNRAMQLRITLRTTDLPILRLMYGWVFGEVGVGWVVSWAWLKEVQEKLGEVEKAGILIWTQTTTIQIDPSRPFHPVIFVWPRKEKTAWICFPESKACNPSSSTTVFRQRLACLTFSLQLC
ncbi:hypothetical protein CPC08DRAFT_20319 [Agrocybe pediades]|nr:hypothetical protein CPC08DRAFT_20319 [Agrocybe pediades]